MRVQIDIYTHTRTGAHTSFAKELPRVPHPTTQIRVFCRVRPHPASVVRCLTGGVGLTLNLDGKEHAFGFDKVFAPGTSQQQVRWRSHHRRTSVMLARLLPPAVLCPI
jgi:hypothetical protein